MNNKEFYKGLAADVMLSFTDAQLEEISKSDDKLKEHFEKVLKIDTTNVKPLFYPYEDIHEFLREDNKTTTIEQKAILQNAPTSEGDYVTIKKVVK